MLNENQIKAVNHIDGPCLTLAGPGSGKTTVLIDRIINLINNGITPDEILVITFTKDAANEMKDRFVKKTKPNIYPVTFGTFHSVFYNILRNHRKYSEYELIGGFKKINLYKECVKAIGLDIKSLKPINELIKEVSYFYNLGVKLDDYNSKVLSKEEFLQFISVLEKRKDEEKVLDFDDMLIKTKNLLTEDSETLKFWQNRFSYFLVDELQDINEVQFEVLNLLLTNHPSGKQNIFGVGDDDQSIYGFRGASPRIMLEFPEIFDNCKSILLDINYRSKCEIVYSAKRLIDCNKERYHKEYRPFSKEDGKVRILNFEDTEAEAKYIANKLKDELNNGSLIETAILYRNRALSNLVSNYLKIYGIEYFSDEIKDNPLDGEIYNDIVSYLKLAVGKYKRDDILRIMNKPNRYLGRGGLENENVSLNEYRNYYPKLSDARDKIDALIRNVETLKSFTPFAAVNYIYKGIGYEYFIKNKLEKEGKSPKEIEKNLKLIRDYAMDFKDIKTLIKDFESEKQEEKPEKRTDESISLFTFHASKGLEFKRVFLIDSVEGITPSKNATSMKLLEEERRMFYVAMTRAKEELVICVPKKIGDETYYPSRFISESFDSKNPCDIMN